MATAKEIALERRVTRLEAELQRLRELVGRVPVRGGGGGGGGTKKVVSELIKLEAGHAWVNLAWPDGEDWHNFTGLA